MTLGSGHSLRRDVLRRHVTAMGPRRNRRGTRHCFTGRRGTGAAAVAVSASFCLGASLMSQLVASLLGEVASR